MKTSNSYTLIACKHRMENCVAANNIKEAINLLMDLARDFCSELVADIVKLSQRFHKLRKQEQQ